MYPPCSDPEAFFSCPGLAARIRPRHSRDGGNPGLSTTKGTEGTKNNPKRAGWAGFLPMRTSQKCGCLLPAGSADTIMGPVDGSRTGLMTTMAILKRECFRVALCRTIKIEPEGVQESSPICLMEGYHSGFCKTRVSQMVSCLVSALRHEGVLGLWMVLSVRLPSTRQ